MLHLHDPDVIQFKTMTYIAARKWSITGIFKLIQFQISFSLTRQIWSAANTPLRKVATLLWNTFTIDVNKRRKSSLVLSVESAAFCEKSSPPLRIAVWFFFMWLLSLWNIRNCVPSYCLSIGFTCVLFVFQNEKFKNHRKHFWDGNRVGKEFVRINLRINFRSMKHLLR